MADGEQMEMNLGAAPDLSRLHAEGVHVGERGLDQGGVYTSDIIHPAQPVRRAVSS